MTLPQGGEAEAAHAAEGIGVPFVHVAAEPGTESVVAAAAVTATSTVRVVVSVRVGDEHPVTLAEEIAVLDNLANGRIGVIAEVGSLPADDAVEDVSVLQASWSGRPVVHRGRRWQVPAGLPGHVAPSAVMVTPAPAQLQVPLWVAGDAGEGVARALSLPMVVTAKTDLDRSSPVAPARDELEGDLETDRQTVIDWSAAGATHLFCVLREPADLEALARYLIPEVAMVGFPRVVAESPRPVGWPRRRNAVNEA